MSLTFAAAAADYVLEHGPLSLEQLYGLAFDAGVTKARGPSSLRSSLNARRFVLRPDGRYDTASRLLSGSVFTSRLRRPPSDGVLWVTRDVEPLSALPALPLPCGGEVRPGAGPVPTWTGPPGWLPDVEAGELVALRWTGSALHAEPAKEVSAADSPRAQDVRRVLARHAGYQHRDAWSHQSDAAIGDVVLSALVEDAGLFRHPLPPLTELLPLPEALRPQYEWASSSGTFQPGTVLQVPVPERVHRELTRRSDLLGERLPDYISMLLSAAADRLLPPAAPAHPSYREYPEYPPYPADDDVPDRADVVRLSRWSR